MNPLLREPRSIHLIAFVTAVVLMLIAELLVGLEEQREGYANSRAADAEVEYLSMRLEDAISDAVSLASSLAIYAEDHSRFGEHYSATLHNQYLQRIPFFRSATLIEGSTIIDVYPRDGNEKAIGLDLATVPAQAEAVEKVRKEKTIIVTGPVGLVQGGRGLLARAPVLRADGTGKGAYWGQVSILLDADQLFDFLRNHGEEVGYRVAIRSGSEGVLVKGTTDIFDKAVAWRKLYLAGAHWELAVTGIDDAISHLPLLYRVFGFSIALLVAGLVQRLLLTHREVLHLALHDTLTGLPNRRLFHDRLLQSIYQAERSRHGLYLLYVDLDNFKPINDTLGHEAGDEVLRVASNRMQEGVRRSDSVARVGGDEFMMILTDIDRKGAARIAAKMIEQLGEPIAFGGETLQIGASIGISHYPEDGESVDTLVRRADEAMYSSKQAGKNRYRFATED